MNTVAVTGLYSVIGLNQVQMTKVWTCMNSYAGFCPGCALAPFALKNSRGRKKPLIDGPEGAPIFSNQKMTKSDFRDIVLVFKPSPVSIWFPVLRFVNTR